MIRCFSFSFQGPPNIVTFQRSPNIGTFQRSPSIGTFQGPPIIGTFHWPLSWDLPSPLSFSFSLNNVFGSFGVFFSEHNFQFESWEYLFLQLSLGGKGWLVLINGEKRGKRLDDCSTFKLMEVSKNNVGSLKF